MGLHRVLVDRRKSVVALDDDLRASEYRLELAPVDAVPVADVPLARRQLAEPVEEPGLRRPVVDHWRARGERVLDRGDDGQLLVLDRDRVDGGGGCRLRLGRHRCDRLAVEAHLVDRDDRTVLDRVAEVRVDVGEVAAGEDADDARDPFCGGGVDRRDPRVRDRAAQDPAVQHPRHEQVADELGLAAELLVCIEPRVRAADLRTACDLDRHSTPARSATASRIPR